MDIKKTDIFKMNRDSLSNLENSNQNKVSIEASKSKENIKDDIIIISNDAKALLDEEKNLLFENEASEMEEMLRNLEEASAEDGPLDMFTKCLKIATRIIKGDNVPNKDIQFLAENMPELHSSAILLKQRNEDPKNHKSLLEDDKDNVEAANDSSLSTASEIIEEAMDIEE